MSKRLRNVAVLNNLRTLHCEGAFFVCVYFYESSAVISNSFFFYIIMGGSTTSTRLFISCLRSIRRADIIFPY